MKKNLSIDVSGLSSYQLTQETRQELTRICDDEAFINQFETMIRGFLIINKFRNDHKSGRTIIKKDFELLKSDAQRLQKTIMDIHPDTYDLLGDTLQRVSFSVACLYGQIEKHEAMMAKDSSLGRKRNSAPLWLTGKMKALLEDHGIKATIYAAGKWCKLTNLALKEAKLNFEVIHLLTQWTKIHS
jgi:hypothetical protein